LCFRGAPARSWIRLKAARSLLRLGHIESFTNQIMLRLPIVAITAQVSPIKLSTKAVCWFRWILRTSVLKFEMASSVNWSSYWLTINCPLFSILYHF
jgi:hypothetical protein